MIQKYTTQLWPSLQQHLNARYQIVTTLDLYDAPNNPAGLHHLIGQVARLEYNNNERIIVTHFDTDYYLGNRGFGLQNFLTSLSYFNISPSKILMFTNYPGIESEIQRFYQENYPLHNLKQDSMKVLVNNYTVPQGTPNPIKLDFDPNTIDYPFMNLNGSRRTHRVMFLCLLKKVGLLEKGLVSWHFEDSQKYDVTLSPTNVNDPTDVTFLTTLPRTRINEWKINSQYHNDCWREYHNLFKQNYKHPLIDGKPNAEEHRFNMPSILKSFVYVSNETAFDYPYPYITEKTFRAIIHQRPFVILGAKGSLNRLHNLGFKTFNSLWDESYDQLDNNQRMDAVLNIVQKICSMDIDQLRTMCYSIKDILAHNYYNYADNYCKLQYQDMLNKL